MKRPQTPRGHWNVLLADCPGVHEPRATVLRASAAA